MDCTKIGSLICRLRKEKRLTQQQLANMLHVSDKAVSKWERGGGCPNPDVLTPLSNILEVGLEELLNGELGDERKSPENMKKLKFYVCLDCGNILTANAEASISCCGKKLTALEAQKANAEEKLRVELIENEYFISSDHEMSKSNYISFAALLTGDTVIMKKLYPEWDMMLRMPRLGRGTLLWYSSSEGLKFQYV